MKLGNFEIQSLNGGTTQMDGGAIFGVVPKPLWVKKYPVNDQNQVPLVTHPLLIQTGDKNILIDTGIGQGKLTDKQLRNYGVTEESQIARSLSQLGLTVEDIDLVLMTHMHFDHATGLTDEEGSAIFPNAWHYIQQDEWHEFISPNIRSKATYWPQNRGTYESKMILFERDIEPYPGIKMVHTGGHSYGHCIIEIESENEKAVHMADILSTSAHINPLWVTAYDDYPMQSIREKERLTRKYASEGRWILFYHDVTNLAIQLTEDGKKIQTQIKRDVNGDSDK
ncbi:YtnP family quorum-quenching lactonase [Staphylococcus chromogenes]|uniref:MBL fold metallo-hydrolase n=1 Tax=Staphylococcus chromogenes TaxID=46126 RepID=A0AAE5T0C6_STACR|nr:MBL fold metallo-hydrolase [Staphylococcus chromogenes]KDP13077.1 metallo-beta-lactamase superfamily protein [Staphylococcus chromogenes MU 970]MBP0045585.1 MBL fold metallo-hydrolase [Staphylococcus chromogenes]MBV5137919.1 MBL fold metallo-hydrolase [Staphylococcus chromogenes]MBV5190704.1 MBL fold metallo-hydrolase [Staphylococcus chromogenes]MBW3132389.1 MBL fold metallo-hydrolase [Staphylococcus chromogenes]